VLATSQCFCAVKRNGSSFPKGFRLREFSIRLFRFLHLNEASYGFAPLVPGMVERGWGRIIFILSESGVQIPAEMVHYGVTKTAQLALSRGIAESVAGLPFALAPRSSERGLS